MKVQKTVKVDEAEALNIVAKVVSKKLGKNVQETKIENGTFLILLEEEVVEDSK